MTAKKKLHRSWALYDWANSAYNLVITSTIFPAYYESMTGDGQEATLDYVTLFGHRFINTALYTYALAVAFGIVAILSPLLSGIADTRGTKKSFLRFFAILGSLSCAGLFFFDEQTLPLGLGLTILACIGYWSSLVFYNSYLPDIALPEEQDKLSAQGFAYGYIGSIVLQLICFVFVLKNELFGITVGKASQISFLLTGVWWLGFATWALRGLPAGIARPGPSAVSGAVSGGYSELRKIAQQLVRYPAIKRFLASFFFYNMGVQTVMLAATLFGKSELGIPTENLIVAILIIQLIAVAGAWVIARVSERWGNLSALMGCVVIWVGVCIAAYFLPAHDPMAFYLLATVVGFVMGGIQSLSRSTYSKMLPATKDTTSWFSFYDVTEKVAIVIGMFSYGIIQEITGSQRASVLSLMVFFVLGLLGLIWTQKATRGIQGEDRSVNAH
ncbi:MAG: MFS transporter [Sphingobacteriales bacterium]|nr:MAG: MFS transporter [Sphingobacteriales bacterium]